MIEIWNIKSLPPAAQVLVQKSTTRSLVENKSNHSEFERSKKLLTRLLSACTIKCFHYTRMTDWEVEQITTTGLLPTSIELLSTRLERLKTECILSQEIIDFILINSPFNSPTSKLTKARSGIWALIQPDPIGDSGVCNLLNVWGGEVANQYLENRGADIGLQNIGKGRVIEFEIPLRSEARGMYFVEKVSEAILLCQARLSGLDSSRFCPEAHLTAPVSPSNILFIHSEGESSYIEMGLTYPSIVVRDLF